jgi:hypothetical protein
MNSPTRLALWRSPGLTSWVIQFSKREQNRMPDAEFFGEAGPRHSGILPNCLPTGQYYPTDVGSWGTKPTFR